MRLRICSFLIAVVLAMVPFAKPLAATPVISVKPCCAAHLQKHHSVCPMCPMCPMNSGSHQCCCALSPALAPAENVSLRGPVDFTLLSSNDPRFATRTDAPLPPPPKRA